MTSVACKAGLVDPLQPIEAYGLGGQTAAAVDDDALTCDEPRALRGKKADHVRNVIGSAPRELPVTRARRCCSLAIGVIFPSVPVASHWIRRRNHPIAFALLWPRPLDVIEDEGVTFTHARLGSAGLTVSRICLGMMSYGNPASRAWHLDEDAAEPIVRRAVEAGITFFDTADIYSEG